MAKPIFRIERGAVSIYIPSTNTYVHIRQGDSGKADVIVATSNLTRKHLTLNAEELLDLMGKIKDAGVA